MSISSVAIKWFAPEVGQEAALTLLDGEGELFAPDLLLAEVTNGLRRKVRKGEFTARQLDAALEELGSTLIFLPLTAGLMREAAAIAADLDHSVYDCIFLVCAKRQSVPFVTADTKLLAKISGLPQWRNVQSLSF